MRNRSWLVGAAALGGMLLGWNAAQRHLVRHRRDLFSPRPLRRLAALSWLEGEGGPESVGLLQDYLAWETRPLLRRKASGLIRRLEHRHG